AGVVFRVRLDVDDRDGASFQQHAAGDAPAIRFDRLESPVPLENVPVELADVRDDPPAIGFKPRNRSVIRSAEADGVHGHAFEDPLEVEVRAAHLLQDLGDRGLTSPRFRELALEVYGSAQLPSSECGHAT